MTPELTFAPTGKIDIGAAFGDAKDAFSPNALAFIVATAIASLANLIPFVGVFTSWGLYYMAAQALSGEQLQFSQLWTSVSERGLGRVFTQALPTMLAPALPMLVGALLFALLIGMKMGGIGAILFGLSMLLTVFAAIRCIFALPAVVAEDIDAVPALKKSWALTGDQLGASIGLVLLVGVVNGVAGFIGFLLLVSIPFSFAMITAAYRQVSEQA